MEENIAEYLADYGTSLKYADFPPEVIHKVKAHLIDALGCALGAYTSEPSKIARRLAVGVAGDEPQATVIGSGGQSSLEMATFANGVMMRYLDFNDGFAGSGVGHPSDNFAPVLTLAGALHAGGKEVITAAVLAYEVFCRLADAFDLRDRGFDHSTLGAASAAVGAAKILGLSREQTVQAINLSVAANISLGQTRVGNLSMWKGCAMANAARNAIFAARLAREGMTGPGPIFEGRYGFIKAVSGPFQLAEEFGGNGRSFRINDVMIKPYPCGQFSQTAIEAALKVRSQLAGPGEIREINIGTFALGKKVMAGDVEKWHPATRESADHSIPYVVAVALTCGTVEIKHFDSQYLSSKELLDLVQKIKVEETAECNNLYPDAMANRVEIVTTSGKRLSELVLYHRGHQKNPLTDAEIELKFTSLAADLLTPAQRKRVLELLWNLEKVDDVNEIMQALII
jgi:2-methylcitrate dehydratase